MAMRPRDRARVRANRRSRCWRTATLDATTVATAATRSAARMPIAAPRRRYPQQDKKRVHGEGRRLSACAAHDRDGRGDADELPTSSVAYTARAAGRLHAAESRRGSLAGRQSGAQEGAPTNSQRQEQSTDDGRRRHQARAGQPSRRASGVGRPKWLLLQRGVRMHASPRELRPRRHRTCALTAPTTPRGSGAPEVTVRTWRSRNSRPQHERTAERRASRGGGVGGRSRAGAASERRAASRRRSTRGAGAGRRAISAHERLAEQPLARLGS